MENIILLLNAISIIGTLIAIFSFIGGLILWFKGILPVLYRLGRGLSSKKIVIFAKNDASTSLINLLADSRLYRKKNIHTIASNNDLGIAENKFVYLVYWPDWKEDIDQVLKTMKDSTALIVYAPQEYGLIPKEVMAKLSEYRNVVVTNFRGRLLNDITTSIITTSYK